MNVLAPGAPGGAARRIRDMPEERPLGKNNPDEGPSPEVWIASQGEREAFVRAALPRNDGDGEPLLRP